MGSVTLQRNILEGGYVIHPSWELAPTLRISPFTEADYAPVTKDDTSNVNQYLNHRFKYWLLTLKAREAITLALSFYHLKEDDVVTILTTSGNHYISGCVTQSIEQFCRWSHEITDKTRVIFVNHEFGYPYQNLSALKEYQLPIIEDRAQSFISTDENGEIGTIGDFVIYSLPKYFPMQVGGILASSHIDVTSLNYSLPRSASEYIVNRLSQGIPHISEWAISRLAHYNYLKKHLAPLGITPYFPLCSGTVPGVFLFRWRDDIDYPKLKVFMQANGVESSVFYGRSAFFIPLNNALQSYQLDYMITLLKHFNDDICKY
jgi:hypothetical protein